MSLVIAICTNDFVVAMGESIEVDGNGNVISNNFNKLVRINDEMIIGCTGKVLDNLELFDDFIGIDDDKGFISIYKDNLSSQEILDILTNRYNNMENKHINNEYIYNIYSFLCWHDGNRFIITVFSLNRITEFQGIGHLVCSEDMSYGCVVGGNNIHSDNLNKYIKEKHPTNILQYKNIMKDVVSQGLLFDNTINDKLHFEKIRKKDIIGL